MQSNPSEFSLTERSYSWWEAWTMVFFKPSSTSFLEILEDPLATPRRAYMWIFFASLVGSVIAGAISFYFNHTQFEPLQSGFNTTIWLGAIGVGLCCLVPLGAALSVLGIIISTGLTQWVAGGLDGRGSYAELIYATAAFTAPLSLISSLIAGIPLVNLFSIVLAIYGFVLNVVAIKAVNRFGTFRALLSMFLVWLGFVMLVAFLVAILITLFTSLNNDFLRELQKQILPYLPTT
jgi:hypothetical protein